MKKKTKHHLIPKCRKENYKKKIICETSRTLMLWENSHKNWHFLFGTMTLQEIILTLQRIHKIKFGYPFRDNRPFIQS